MKNRHIKVLIFCIVTFVILCLVSDFLKLKTRIWVDNDNIPAFYKQQKNTLQTVFLGTSVIQNGIIPMELYEKYGISSYNLGTANQPMLASYYWLKEAYKYHSNTLNTVVMDISALRKTTDYSFYQNAMDSMRCSINKWNAVGAYTDSFQEQIAYFVPLFEYHSRWENLNSSDFLRNVESASFLKGYNYDDRMYIEDKDNTTIIVPEYIPNISSEEMIFEKESLLYLKKIKMFCDEHNINLVLIKTPGTEVWFSSHYIAAENLCNQYNLDYLDFNFEPLISEIDFCQAVDTMDGCHLNYYGALKLTDYLGKYLTDNYGNKRLIRGDGYTEGKKELVDYTDFITERQIYKKTNDITSYVEYALSDINNVVFITMKDEMAIELSDEQRNGLKDLGLEKLSLLGYRDSYIGIIDGGKVIREISESDSNIIEENSSDFVNDLEVEESELKKTLYEPLHLSAKGQIGLDVAYELKSGGNKLGCISSCYINGKEYSQNVSGLNIVIYNKEKNIVVDIHSFNTNDEKATIGDLMDTYRIQMSRGDGYDDMTGKVADLYLYNKRCATRKELISLYADLTDEGFLYYITHFINRDNTIIFISACNDAATMVSEDARQFLKGIGLRKLSDIQIDNPYIGIIVDGDVYIEKLHHNAEPIIQKGVGYEISSGEEQLEYTSSIRIENTEYSRLENGLNVVVYDTELMEVIDSRNFNTGIVPMAFQENIGETGEIK